MNVSTAVVVAVLGLWFSVSVVSQPPRIGNILRRYDPSSLLPNWSFFAPRPVSFDYHLLYRDLLHDLTVSDWTEIPIVEERAWYCFLWNPKRRRKKALFDSCSMLLRLRSSLAEQGIDQPEALHRAVPYLMLLNYVTGLPHPLARGTQFLILRTFGPTLGTPPTAVFTSRFHRVQQAGQTVFTNSPRSISGGLAISDA